MTPALDGVLVVDKPEGVTSHDVVAAVRRRLPKGTKVGHTGTLDPFATGVLPVVTGKATRLSQFLTGVRKRYVAGVTFGTATDSGDRTGAVVATAVPTEEDGLTEASVAEALAGFVGTHPQVPPAHSAKKVDGERAYALARRGERVALAPVAVTAHTIGLERWDATTRTATVSLEVSAGYYVRSLARDLGEALGVPAHLSSLRRTASGTFGLADAHALGDVVGAGVPELSGWLVPMHLLLTDWPSVTLDGREADAVRHGQPCRLARGMADAATHGRVRLLDPDGRLIGLARPADGRPADLHADIVLG